MRIAFWLAGCVAFGSLASPLFAEEKFERKYVEGSQRKYQTESKVDQTLTIAGMAVETKVTSFVVANAVAGQRGADGKLAVEETINTLQSNMALPGGLTLQFDSANPDKEADNPALNPLLDVYRALLKNPITITVDRENKVVAAAYANNPKDTLPKEVQSFLDPDLRKRESEQAWLFLPDKPVAKGDQWERFIDKDLGGGQTMNFRMLFTYAGPETKNGKTYHKFDTKHQEVTYSMDPNVNPMVQVSKSDLKVGKSSGSILYDPATGDIPNRDASVNITGTMTLVINGMEFPSELDLTMTEKTALQN